MLARSLQGLKKTKSHGNGATRKIAEMLKFPRREDGEREKEMEGNGKEGKGSRRDMIQDRMGWHVGKEERIV